MPVIAKLNYLRIAPRKTRLVADLIRGKTIQDAQDILNFTRKGAVSPILKLLKSAAANAKNNFQLDEKNLFISKILVDEGPRLKRTFPRSRGRADIIQKKTSHITLVLEEIVEGKVTSKRPAAGKKEEKKEKEVKEISDKEKPKVRPEFERVKPTKGKTLKMYQRKTF